VVHESPRTERILDRGASARPFRASLASVSLPARPRHRDVSATPGGFSVPSLSALRRADSLS
ncbi:MAG: hypothetical protein PHO89_11430, partial [Methylacidiphilaceae bacterium]|nr:hypothetical protein [Candidatus Methylacidiphilaceae bacterium]